MRLSISMCSKVVVLSAALAISAETARAGWGPDGVTIRATSANIEQVAAVADGSHGAIVAWREGTETSGVIRALHVLPSGDVDAAWPVDGVVICDLPVGASSLTALSDGAGGAYIWWIESPKVYLTHVTASGTVATGWPTRGRYLNGLYPRPAVPSVIGDGQGGVFVAIATLVSITGDYSGIRLLHIDALNIDAPGYPAAGKVVVGGGSVTTWDLWPSLAIAPEGGVYLAWASWSEDPATVASAQRLIRLDANGAPAPGWPNLGIELEDFPGEALGWDPYYSINGPGLALVAVAPDETGGVFAVSCELTASYDLSYEPKLFRFQADGNLAPGWPGTGRALPTYTSWYWDRGPVASMRLLPDRVGGVQFGSPTIFDHGTNFGFQRSNPAQDWVIGYGVGGSANSIDFVPNSVGGMFYADCYFGTKYGPYSDAPHILVRQSYPGSGWTDFFEGHSEPLIRWYGDIALAESGDGGAYFFWSQMNQRFGLFARRFNGEGEVTAVSPPVRVRAPLELSALRFVAGQGVRATVSVPEDESATLELFDVSGRRVASSRLTAADAGRSVTIAGTGMLPSGLYFARHSSPSAAASGKVLVAR